MRSSSSSWTATHASASSATPLYSDAEHTLTVTVTDTASQATQANVVVTAEPNELPLCAWISPQDRQSDDGGLLRFRPAESVAPLDIVPTGGLNLGWPLFEGREADPDYTPLLTQNRFAPNPLSGTTGG